MKGNKNIQSQTVNSVNKQVYSMTNIVSATQCVFLIILKMCWWIWL